MDCVDSRVPTMSPDDHRLRRLPRLPVTECMQRPSSFQLAYRSNDSTCALRQHIAWTAVNQFDSCMSSSGDALPQCMVSVARDEASPAGGLMQASGEAILSIMRVRHQ